MLRVFAFEEYDKLSENAGCHGVVSLIELMVFMPIPDGTGHCLEAFVICSIEMGRGGRKPGLSAKGAEPMNWYPSEP